MTSLHEVERLQPAGTDALQGSRSGLRSEIQVLGAFAVLAVVINHWAPGLSLTATASTSSSPSPET